MRRERCPHRFWPERANAGMTDMSLDRHAGKDEVGLQPVTWLARARAQSLELAEERASRIPTWRQQDVPRADGVLAIFRRPVALTAMAALLLLALASCAWAAWAMVRARHLELQSPTTSAQAPVPTPIIDSQSPQPVVAPFQTPVAVVPAKATSPSTTPRKKSVSRATSIAPPTTSGGQRATLEEPDGDLILVAPHEAQPPLLSPDKWQRRGSQSE